MKTFFSIFSLFFIVTASYSQDNTYKTAEDGGIISLIEQTIDSSIFYYDKGIYTKSLMSNIKLLGLAEKIDNPRYLNKAYRFLAYDFLIINDTLQARDSFEKAKKYAEIFNDDLTIGLSFMDLANYHTRSDYNYNKALKYHDISILKLKKAKDSTELSKAYYNAIITAFYAEKFEKGKGYLIALGNPSFDQYKPKYCFSSEKSYWATYYINKKQFVKAEIEAKKALNFANSSENATEIYDAYEQLATSLYGQKKYKEAYENRLLSEKYYDESISQWQDTQSEAALAELKIKQYEDQIKDQKVKTELQAQIADNKNKLNKTLIFICISGVILFIGLLFAFRKRRELNKALEIKNEEYLKAKQESEHLARVKSQFFSTVSHELRTPLYGVIGLSTLLLEDEKLQNHEKDLKSLKFSADYLLALINDVLQISKIDANNFEDEETKPFNVKDTLNKIISSFEYMRLQNKNEITLSIDDEVPQVLKGNTTRLYQILMNLIGNAYKFTEDGHININLTTISKNENSARILFKISDTGIGMPEKKLKTIFDEFTQIENLDYSYQGTGLGLPIVKKLINLLKSEIYVESELGKGTTFSFELDYAISTEVVAPKEKLILDDITLKDKKILIAEDNRINQIVTKKILEKKGVLCKIVDNGEEAIEATKNEIFNLILMDINMPIKDGFEAAKTIRLNNIKTPILALTAVEMTEVRNKVYKMGMNDIIVKPYDVDKFIRTIIKNLD